MRSLRPDSSAGDAYFLFTSRGAALSRQKPNRTRRGPRTNATAWCRDLASEPFHSLLRQICCKSASP